MAHGLRNLSLGNSGMGYKSIHDYKIHEYFLFYLVYG